MEELTRISMCLVKPHVCPLLSKIKIGDFICDNLKNEICDIEICPVNGYHFETEQLVIERDEYPDYASKKRLYQNKSRW